MQSKKESATPRAYNKYQTQSKKDTRIKRSNALTPKQKEEGRQEQLYLKSNEKGLWSKTEALDRCQRIPRRLDNIQKPTQYLSNIKVTLKRGAYMIVHRKTACIRGCLEKTHMHTLLIHL